MTTNPKGFIVLVHNVMGPITDEEIILALPEAHRSLPRHTLSITPEKIQHGEAMRYDWRSMLIEQERIFDTQVKPILEKHPDYEVLYFGLAPIPLAIHLGHKLSSFRKAKVFLKDHTLKQWKWPKAEAGEPQLKNVPSEVVRAKGEVLIRFGTRFEIHEADTTNVVREAIKEIELYPPKFGGDIFGSYEQMAQYASSFRDALDAIASNLPQVHDVHLFAAIPVGMAFLIGQEISPTSHPLVHVYEYSKDQTPRYYPAYTVNEDLNAQALEISGKERKAFQQLREGFQSELDDFKETFLQPLEEEVHWFEGLFPDEKQSKSLFKTKYWSHLLPLNSVVLKTNFLDGEKAGNTADNEGYYFGDAFLKLLTQQLQSEEERKQALRLFCFHVTINRNAHRVQSEQADLLYRYPRVLEEIDYQADVYALLNEFHYAGFLHESAGKHFAQLIDVLLQTLWAIDRAKGKTEQMEVHRVNRYLTWYYLAAQLETGSHETLSQVLELLSAKPTIELKFNAVRVSRERVFFDFKTYDAKELGICLFHRGRMKSEEVAIQMVPIARLIEGLTEQNPDKVKEVLQALITQTSD